MEKERIFIEAESQKGNLKLTKSELLQTLNLPETGVLWQKTATEYIFFSKEKWEWFTKEMKRLSGMTEGQLHWTKKGCDFTRGLYSRGEWTDVQANVLHISRGSTMRKKLPVGISRLEICI